MSKKVVKVTFSLRGGKWYYVEFTLPNVPNAVRLPCGKVILGEFSTHKGEWQFHSREPLIACEAVET